MNKASSITFWIFLCLALSLLFTFNTSCSSKYDIQFRHDTKYQGEGTGFYLYVEVNKLLRMMEESGKTEDEIVNQLIKENLEERSISYDSFVIDRKTAYRGDDRGYYGHTVSLKEK